MMKSETSTNTNISVGGFGVLLTFILFIVALAFMAGTYFAPSEECPDYACQECPDFVCPEQSCPIITKTETVEICSQEAAFNECVEIINNAKDLEMMTE